MQINEVKQTLEEWTAARIFPGASLLVQKNGEVLLEHACGFADVERKRAVRLDDIWVVASIAKPVAAVALMQMVDRGLLDLNQSVTELLPDFHHNRVLLRHLLTHTSGIGPMEPEEEEIQRLGRIRAIAAQDLLFEPGTKCSYSTPALDLVEAIVCEKSGLSWVEYTKTNIFDPLGMNETSYRPPVEWDERIPVVYDQEDRVDPWWNARYLPAIGLAGGGLFSTLRDLSRFGQALLNSGTPILTQSSWREMLTLQTAGLFNLEGQPQTWGLGWYLNQDGGDGFGPLSTRAFGHGGITGTWLCVDPEHQLIVVKLANRLDVSLEDSTRMQNHLLTRIMKT